jgi:transcriptional regulator with XRE-family HTH domain
MDRKNLLIEIGIKLRQARQSLHFTMSQLADNVGNDRTGYSRYEKGKVSPKLVTLYKLGEMYDISLDWLIRNKGPMFYKEKEIKEPEKIIVEIPAPSQKPTVDSLPADTRELLDHMEKIPLLRHEVLAFFLKFKNKNKELVADAFAAWDRQDPSQENGKEI